jgi:hypothetical protein
MILKSIFAKAVLATIASANSLTPRLSPGRVQGNDDPVFIDKLGHYLRVGFMNDSSLIGGYTELSENGEDVLRVIRSTDGANSWKPLGEVFRGDRKTHDINNVFPLQLENGRILYAHIATMIESNPMVITHGSEFPFLTRTMAVPVSSTSLL